MVEGEKAKVSTYEKENKVVGLVGQGHFSVVNLPFSFVTIMCTQEG